MSERRALACAAGAAFVLAFVAGTPSALPAQSADSLRARLGRVSAARALADTTVRRLEQERSARRTARIRSGGRTVAYDPALLTPEDSGGIAAGLALGLDRLVERFGEEGRTLVDSATWVAVGIPWWFGQRRVELRTATSGAAESLHLPRPLDPERVARFVLQAAGASLAPSSAALSAWSPWSVSLAGEEVRFAEAGRELALSWAAVGRRCSAGSALACRRALEPVPGEDRLGLLFDASDWRAVVTASPLPALTDSIFFSRRRACLAGDDPACAQIVARLTPPDPFSGGMRATLIMHAIDLGGRDALRRFRSSTEREPVPLLAEVAGVSEDSLIMSWQRRTAVALTAERRGAIPLSLSVAGWTLLLLGGATFRRPR